MQLFNKGDLPSHSMVFLLVSLGSVDVVPPPHHHDLHVSPKISINHFLWFITTCSSVCSLAKSTSTSDIYIKTYASCRFSTQIYFYIWSPSFDMHNTDHDILLLHFTGNKQISLGVTIPTSRLGSFFPHGGSICYMDQGRWRRIPHTAADCNTPAVVAST